MRAKLRINTTKLQLQLWNYNFAFSFPRRNQPTIVVCSGWQNQLRREKMKNQWQELSPQIDREHQRRRRPPKPIRMDDPKISCLCRSRCNRRVGKCHQPPLRSGCNTQPRGNIGVFRNDSTKRGNNSSSKGHTTAGKQHQQRSFSHTQTIAKQLSERQNGVSPLLCQKSSGTWKSALLVVSTKRIIIGRLKKSEKSRRIAGEYNTTTMWTNDKI